jgi:hypothetical protein
LSNDCEFTSQIVVEEELVGHGTQVKRRVLGRTQFAW